MAIPLKQSTAVTVPMGPFLDSIDGKTEELSLTIAQADIRLSKNGGNIAQSNNAAGGTHDELGYYGLPLDTTDTGTLGHLRVIIHKSGALPVWQDFVILPANVYDAMILGTDLLQVDADQIDGDATAATNLKILMDGNEAFYSAYSGPRGPGVYLNDAAGNTNTVNGVDGTIGNPVSTIAAAKTIADSLSLDRIYLVNDSGITLAATMVDYEFVGIGHCESNTIALASQDVSNSSFYNVKITGVQGGTGHVHCEDCCFGTATLHLFALRCGFSDASTGVTFSNNDDNILEGCYSMVPGNTAPKFICSAANLDLSVRHYSGGIEFVGLNATTAVSVETDGQVIFASGCNVNAAVTMRGCMSITDNTAGMNSLTTDAVLNQERLLAAATALFDLANGVETGVTPRQSLRGILSSSVGKLSGAATTEITIRDVPDTKNRITATVDADGNRSVVTLDLT